MDLDLNFKDYNVSIYPSKNENNIEILNTYDLIFNLQMPYLTLPEYTLKPNSFSHIGNNIYFLTEANKPYNIFLKKYSKQNLGKLARTWAEFSSEFSKRKVDKNLKITRYRGDDFLLVRTENGDSSMIESTGKIMSTFGALSYNMNPNFNFKFESSDPTIVTVDKYGSITRLSPNINTKVCFIYMWEPITYSPNGNYSVAFYIFDIFINHDDDKTSAGLYGKTLEEYRFLQFAYPIPKKYTLPFFKKVDLTKVFGIKKCKKNEGNANVTIEFSIFNVDPSPKTGPNIALYGPDYLKANRSSVDPGGNFTAGAIIETIVVIFHEIHNSSKISTITAFASGFIVIEVVPLFDFYCNDKLTVNLKYDKTQLFVDDTDTECILYEHIEDDKTNLVTEKKTLYDEISTKRSESINETHITSLFATDDGGRKVCDFITSSFHSPSDDSLANIDIVSKYVKDQLFLFNDVSKPQSSIIGYINSFIQTYYSFMTTSGIIIKSNTEETPPALTIDDDKIINANYSSMKPVCDILDKIVTDISKITPLTTITTPAAPGSPNDVYNFDNYIKTQFVGLITKCKTSCDNLQQPPPGAPLPPTPGAPPPPNPRINQVKTSIEFVKNLESYLKEFLIFFDFVVSFDIFSKIKNYNILINEIGQSYLLNTEEESFGERIYKNTNGIYGSTYPRVTNVISNTITQHPPTGSIANLQKSLYEISKSLPPNFLPYIVDKYENSTLKSKSKKTSDGELNFSFNINDYEYTFDSKDLSDKRNILTIAKSNTQSQKHLNLMLLSNSRWFSICFKKIKIMTPNKKIIDNIIKNSLTLQFFIQNSSIDHSIEVFNKFFFNIEQNPKFNLVITSDIVVNDNLITYDEILNALSNPANVSSSDKYREIMNIQQQFLRYYIDYINFNYDGLYKKKYDTMHASINAAQSTPTEKDKTNKANKDTENYYKFFDLRSIGYFKDMFYDAIRIMTAKKGLTPFELLSKPDNKNEFLYIIKGLQESDNDNKMNTYIEKIPQGGGGKLDIMKALQQKKRPIGTTLEEADYNLMVPLTIKETKNGVSNMTVMVNKIFAPSSSSPVKSSNSDDDVIIKVGDAIRFVDIVDNTVKYAIVCGFLSGSGIIKQDVTSFREEYIKLQTENATRPLQRTAKEYLSLTNLRGILYLPFTYVDETNCYKSPSSATTTPSKTDAVFTFNCDDPEMRILPNGYVLSAWQIIKNTASALISLSIDNSVLNSSSPQYSIGSYMTMTKATIPSNFTNFVNMLIGIKDGNPDFKFIKGIALTSGLMSNESAGCKMTYGIDQSKSSTKNLKFRQAVFKTTETEIKKEFKDLKGGITANDFIITLLTEKTSSRSDNPFIGQDGKPMTDVPQLVYALNLLSTPKDTMSLLLKALASAHNLNNLYPGKTNIYGDSDQVGGAFNIFRRKTETLSSNINSDSLAKAKEIITQMIKFNNEQKFITDINTYTNTLDSAFKELKTQVTVATTAAAATASNAAANAASGVGAQASGVGAPGSLGAQAYDNGSLLSKFSKMFGVSSGSKGDKSSSNIGNINTCGNVAEIKCEGDKLFVTITLNTSDLLNQCMVSHDQILGMGVGGVAPQNVDTSSHNVSSAAPHAAPHAADIKASIVGNTKSSPLITNPISILKDNVSEEGSGADADVPAPAPTPSPTPAGAVLALKIGFKGPIKLDIATSPATFDLKTIFDNFKNPTYTIAPDDKNLTVDSAGLITATATATETYKVTITQDAISIVVEVEVTGGSPPPGTALALKGSFKGPIKLDIVTTTFDLKTIFDNFKNPTYTIAPDDKNLTVDSAGLITATATAIGNYKVTIKQDATSIVVEVEVTGGSPPPGTLALKTGKSRSIKIDLDTIKTFDLQSILDYVEPSKITYASSDDTTLTVSSAGLITATAIGNYKVTIKQDSTSIVVEVEVTGGSPPPTPLFIINEQIEKNLAKIAALKFTPSW